MLRRSLVVLFLMSVLGATGCGGKAQIDAPKVTGTIQKIMNSKDNARTVE